MNQPVNVVCHLTPEGFACDVTVGSDPAATRHTVSVSQDDLARLAPGHYDPEELVAGVVCSATRSRALIRATSSARRNGLAT